MGDFTINLPDSGGGPLTENEVLAARIKYGPNVIERKSVSSCIRLLLRALFHPFNILLTLLATASGSTGDFDTMAIMLFMVTISTLLRFYQEWKSQREAKSLLAMVSSKVYVLRRRSAESPMVEVQIHTENLVPGDWVRLYPGDVIPADLTIQEAKSFFVSQASLTGESFPVEKYPPSSIGPASDLLSAASGIRGSTSMHSVSSSSNSEKPLTKNEKIGERRRVCLNFFRAIIGLRPQLGRASASVQGGADFSSPNLCFMGTSVISGSATGLIIATGKHTYFGTMARNMSSSPPENAFQLGVRRISWIFFITMSCMVPPVLLLQGLLNESWSDATLFALSVAVGLTPEMLPMIVNTALAKGSIQMSGKKCIVKNLDAIISMGGVQVLCTDKTGTLTQSTVTLQKCVNLRGEEFPVALNLGYLNARFLSSMKNPIDESIKAYFDNTVESIRAMMKCDDCDVAEDFALLDEMPFDFTRRRASVLLGHRTGYQILICKGAYEETIAACSNVLTFSSSEQGAKFPFLDIRFEEMQKMTPSITEGIFAQADALGDDGFRVIAVACKVITTPNFTVLDQDSEKDLTFVGFLAFHDPPKDTASLAIKRLIDLNIDVKVLTGDTGKICEKVCKEIQLPVKGTIEFNQKKVVSNQEIMDATIFSKLTPLQKVDIVRSLKESGKTVAFIGDGINDAAALIEADVGISVDTGTEIAKESADIILLDRNLSVVADGVETGRTTYGNTIKYIVMAVSSNFGNVFSILVASAWLPFLPMLPIHVLVQNLLYDISQISIPWDHMDPEFLLVPHNWSMKSVMRFMVCMGPISSIFDISTFAFMYFYYDIKDSNDESKVRIFQTTWFMVGTLTQTMVVHMIRTSKIPFIQSRASVPVIVMTVTMVSVALSLPYIPGVSDWLKLAHVSAGVYLFVVGIIFAYCVTAQLAKMLYIRVFGKWY